MHIVEATDGDMLEHGIAAKTTRFQRYGSPEVLHPCEMRRPVDNMGHEDRTEQLIAANGTVKRLDQIGNQRIVNAKRIGLCGLFRSGPFGIAGFGHDLDSDKVYFICTVYTAWQLISIYDMHVL